MTGFLVSTAAVFLTAWIVYAATYRAAYMEGKMDEARTWRRMLGVKDVPAGTCATRCHPADCDDSCPRYSELRGMTAAELRAHVDRDDEIYGRNG